MADLTVVERLIETINEIGPDLVVVSGDLTQRAKTKEFIAAREMLDRLPRPQIVVPGNHDVPMYNVYHRFAEPLTRYKRHITEDLSPFYSDDELAVAGVNTTRSLTIKGGRINAKQVAEIRLKMDKLPERLLKVVVTHHPFDVPDGEDERDIVRRAKKAMPLIAESGADVFLAGHLHVSHIGNSARRYKLDDGYSALIIQAGTAASTRERGEENSFNVLEHEYPFLTVTRYQCSIPTEGFRLAKSERFSHDDHGWSRT
jgi:Predicted phosphohydrolases